MLFAGGLAIFLGLVGLAVDVGQLVGNRTDLQKTADAMALAGAWELPDSTTAATSEANDYAEFKGVDGINGQVTSITFLDSVTVRVEVQRTVDYALMPALGLSDGSVTATATARNSAVTGFLVDELDVYPYTVWGGNTPPPNGCDWDICIGDTVVYRSNAYRDLVEPDYGSNSNGQVNGNNFKGYFHAGGDVVYLDEGSWQTFSRGGNAMGQQPLAALDQHYADDEPIVLPVIEAAKCTGGCGTLQFEIVAWVCIDLDARGNASQDWTGTVIGWCPAPITSVGYTDQGTVPPDTFPNPRTVQLID